MNIRVVIAATLLLMALGTPLFAQENSPLDLSGTWRWIHYEDLRERHPGAYPGDYFGIPVNDAARMRADTYDEEWLSSSPLLQCRPRGPGYQAIPEMTTGEQGAGKLASPVREETDGKGPGQGHPAGGPLHSMRRGLDTEHPAKVTAVKRPAGETPGKSGCGT